MSLINVLPIGSNLCIKIMDTTKFPLFPIVSLVINEKECSNLHMQINLNKSVGTTTIMKKKIINLSRYSGRVYYLTFPEGRSPKKGPIYRTKSNMSGELCSLWGLWRRMCPLLFPAFRNYLHFLAGGPLCSNGTLLTLLALSHLF